MKQIIRKLIIKPYQNYKLWRSFHPKYKIEKSSLRYEFSRIVYFIERFFYLCIEKIVVNPLNDWTWRRK